MISSQERARREVERRHLPETVAAFVAAMKNAGAALIALRKSLAAENTPRETSDDG